MKFSLLASALAVLSYTSLTVLAGPTPTRTHRKRAPAGFVSTEGNNFVVDGVTTKFPGTNAYWMFLLNEESDIVSTFQEYQQSDIKVVRIWAFREAVGSPPAVGNFTQLWQNGKATCSQQGIARLQFILDTADSFGIKVVFALTNNWVVDFPANDTSEFPPGYFSNSYGGIDTFVQQIAPGSDHDSFYTDQNIISAYQSWLQCVVTPFTSHSALFSWELANDPRCQGAVGTTTSAGCNTLTITSWVSSQAKFLKSIDPNHLVAAGNGGFLCTQSTCPKLNSVPPPPSHSNGVGSGSSGAGAGMVVKKKRGWLTTAQVLARARESEKAARALLGIKGPKSRKQIRGGWSAGEALSVTATKDKRDASSLGDSYNGHWGVDSQDICADPSIDFCTLQIFPDQNFYGISGTGTTLGRKRQSDSSPGTSSESISDAVNFVLNNAHDSSKPVAALAVGVTSSSHSNHLNHFDSSQIGPSSNQVIASDSEQQTAVSSLAGTASSIQAMFPWQQGNPHVSSEAGSIVQGSDSSSKRWTFGPTPDDGYAFFPNDPIWQIWFNTAQSLNSS